MKNDFFLANSTKTKRRKKGRKHMLPSVLNQTITPKYARSRTECIYLHDL